MKRSRILAALVAALLLLGTGSALAGGGGNPNSAGKDQAPPACPDASPNHGNPQDCGHGPACPDDDGDDVCNADDLCPNEDEDGQAPDPDDGCPAPDPCTDTDGDGVCDEDDACPNDPANDTDDDGVCDDVDQCDTEAGPASNNGCPEAGPACVEDGIDAFKPYPLNGVASGIVHNNVEPGLSQIPELGPTLAGAAHTINCTAVVPVEDTIDGVLAP
jgi:hypothetical protein